MLKIDFSNAKGFLPDNWLEGRQAKLAQAHDWLCNATGAGGEYTGWVNLPRDYDKDEFARIQKAAAKIQKDSQVLVVIGIGGSYLGGRAVLELLGSADHKLNKNKGPEVFFAGCGLSTDALCELIEYVKDKEFSVNVISKSGTTTEPAVAFRIFKALLEEKYGKDGAKGRIYATTDAARGALKGLSDSEGYETFVVPDAVGGRYSVLTAVGLLPLAAAGIDIVKLMDGAREAMDALHKPGLDNVAWQYAAARNALLDAGKSIELLVGYEPSFRFFAEWWKQLYGESEGKQGKGLFPASVEFTADLHSMGQYIQDGQRILMETVVKFASTRSTITIPNDPADVDGLNFLSGKDLAFVAEQALRGTLLAHVDGGVPNLILEAAGRDETTVGQLIYFFEFACGISGYVLGVNPFDQPGVEAYKKNMFALLGKPGFEAQREELLKRL